MQYLGVLVAAAAAYAFGAVWYMALAKPWMAASGVPVGEDGRPANGMNPMPFIISGIAVILVAGMMRHVMIMASLSTFLDGLMTGFGLGAFVVLPWIVTNYAYAARPRNLTYIDGAYATVGCTIIGVVLSFFL
jgi:hypothetical protein